MEYTIITNFRIHKSSVTIYLLQIQWTFWRCYKFICVPLCQNFLLVGARFGEIYNKYIHQVFTNRVKQIEELWLGLIKTLIFHDEFDTHPVFWIYFLFSFSLNSFLYPLFFLLISIFLIILVLNCRLGFNTLIL